MKSYKPTLRTALLFVAMVLATVSLVTLFLVRQSTAQSCPSNPCKDDPCCGLLENCSVTSSSCQNAGWIWNFTNSTCSKPASGRSSASRHSATTRPGAPTAPFRARSATRLIDFKRPRRRRLQTLTCVSRGHSGGLPILPEIV